MPKNDGKIIILTTSEKLVNSSKEAISKLGLSIEVECVKGSTVEEAYENFIKKAKAHKNRGIEIIITRQGGGKIIKSKVDIDIMEMEIKEYDILKCLYKYKDYNKSIAVVEIDPIIEDVKKIGGILGLDIRTYLANYKNTYMKMKEAIDDGIEIVISGSGTFYEIERDLLKNKGVIYEEIEPSEISVIQAIRKAYKLLEVTLKEREKTEMLKTVLDFSNQGIISIDKNGNITTLNPNAEKIFRMNENTVVGKPIHEVIPGAKLQRTLLTREVEIGVIESIEDFQVVTDRIPLSINDEIVGAIATFQEAKYVQEVEQKIRYKLSNKGLTAKYTFQSIKGKSDKIKEIIKMAKTYSGTSSTVLITGETGTGKEVFAQAIHNESNRKNNPFVAINCSALPGNLLESELFGYVEGAFTGARKGGKQGIFELAHGGTIFLDEIGEIDKTVQARLLRVIQEREIMRIGDDKIIPIDVRIIAATNRDLYKEVENDNFRSDLYFRLDILSLIIPPLRERKEDIEELVKEFIQKLNRRLKCKVSGVDADILKIFKNYDWPGNIRELQNMLEKMMVVTRNGMVKADHIAFIIKQFQRKKYDTKEEDIYNGSLSEIEKKIIIRVLEEENYNKSRTAKRLGIDRTTLFRKLERNE